MLHACIRVLCGYPFVACRDSTKCSSSIRRTNSIVIDSIICTYYIPIVCNIWKEGLVRFLTNKVQTSFWVDPELYHMVKMSGMNLTQFVNRALNTYFNASDAGKLREEIKELEMKTAVLKSVLKTAEESESKVDVVQNHKEGLLQTLKEKYDNYNRANKSRKHNIFWLEGPKYKEYRIGLKMSAGQLLDALEELK